MRDTKDILENEIYPNLDIAEALIDLDPQDKGEYYAIRCPSCQKKEAFVYRNRPYINCSRLNKCGFSQSIWDYIQTSKGLDNSETLKELARLAGVTLPSLDPEAIKRIEEAKAKANLWEDVVTSFKVKLWPNPDEIVTINPGEEDADPREIEHKSDLVKSAFLMYHLKKGRGYTEQEIKNMDLGLIGSRDDLENDLSKKGYKGSDMIEMSLSLSHIGKEYQLVIPYRDHLGRVAGIVARSNYIEPKYLYSKGLSLDFPFNLDRAKGSKTLIVVEGFLDALILRERGIKNVIALGGSSFSDVKIDHATKWGTQAFILALDGDEAGLKGTEKAIERIEGRGLKSYVATLPAKWDPDSIVREKGIEAFRELLDKAISGPAWKALRIIEKHDTKTTPGRDQAIEEALGYEEALKDPLDSKDFIDAIAHGLNISKEIIEEKTRDYRDKKGRDRLKQGYQELFREGAKLLGEEKVEELKEYTEEKARELRTLTVTRTLTPYTLAALQGDIERVRPGLETGYRVLDSIFRIPQEAITIVGGRPSHGKTTFLMNLLLNMADRYTDRSFFFFSYEETRKMIGLKLLNILSRDNINPSMIGGNIQNLENYIRGRNTDRPLIEGGKQTYEDLVESKRVWVIDEPYYVDELADQLAYFSERYDIGAAFIDYIQKIKIKGRYQTRQIELQKVSERILETAKGLSIPIIMGAQFGREKERRDKVRLDNLREAGDIEQDANLVLGLHNPAMDKAQDEVSEYLREQSDLTITVLKNRNGPVNQSENLMFNRPTLSIVE